MSLETVFADIESNEFAARVSIASSLSIFKDALHGQESYRDLVVALSSESKRQTNSKIILNRLNQLLRLSTDYQYENPNDIALATYTYALAESNSSWANVAASLVVQAHRTWWFNAIAGDVLRDIGTQLVDKQALAASSAIIGELSKVFETDSTMTIQQPITLTPDYSFEIKELCEDWDKNGYGVGLESKHIIEADDIFDALRTRLDDYNNLESPPTHTFHKAA